MDSQDIGEVWTLQEVADRLRIPYRRVRDAVFAGEWPCLKVSTRKRLMTEADVRAVIALLHADPPPAPSPLDARQSRKNVLELMNAA